MLLVAVVQACGSGHLRLRPLAVCSYPVREVLLVWGCPGVVCVCVCVYVWRQEGLVKSYQFSHMQWSDSPFGCSYHHLLAHNSLLNPRAQSSFC